MSHKRVKDSHKGLTNWQKATALVPLALLSGAWTTSLAATGSASAAAPNGPRLPDGTSLPAAAVKSPASVSLPGEIAPGVPAGSTQDVIAGSSTNGIPAAALAAYQRAAQVIDAADTGCHIDWTLIAAIGRVESDHGRYGGNTLGADGVSRPGIYGIPLDGTHGTTKVMDTDGGQYDNDPIYDRAVGPMQFIPSTWQVVGVDGDGDGKRNPQDLNDAALATAVYLCSGNEDLGTASGRQSAVYRYNHSQEYVDLVLSIMRAYAGGNYSSVPDGTAAPTTFTSNYGDSVWSSGTRGYHPRPHRRSSGGSAHHSGGASTAGSGSTGGSGSTATSGGGTAPAPSSPTSPTAPTSGVTKAAQPVIDTISAGSEAVTFCKNNLPSLSPLSSADQTTVINACADKIVGMTPTQAKAAIPDTLTATLQWLGLTSLLPTGGLSLP
ncbi:MAG: lytic murein transglycosylase [Nocardioidaceae bacterium]